MRARIEPFGAWVRLADDTLVAVTRSGARKLGMVGGAVWDDARIPDPPPPLEAHVAVTSRCGAGCPGCYLDAKPDGVVPPFDTIVARLRELANAGVFTVAFGGGEPLGRHDLGALATAARGLDLTPVVTTSGIGMTAERARSLRDFAQVNVSYDGPGDAYRQVRGFDGAAVAERAMTLLAEANVPFGVNTVLTRANFDAVPAAVERAEALGAREVQLLRYKPAGRAAGVDYLEKRLTPEQVDALYPMLASLALARTISLRVDCAMLPLLSGHALDPALLARFGVFGCEAGRHLASVDIDGKVGPCSFSPPSGVEAFSQPGWRSDAHLERWRSLPAVEPCRSCDVAPACRGGCKVVSGALRAGDDASPFGPDPECPRVRAQKRT